MFLASLYVQASHPHKDAFVPRSKVMDKNRRCSASENFLMGVRSCLCVCASERVRVGEWLGAECECILTLQLAEGEN